MGNRCLLTGVVYMLRLELQPVIVSCLFILQTIYSQSHLHGGAFVSWWH